MQNRDAALSQDAIQQIFNDLQKARKQGPKFICQSPQSTQEKLTHIHKLVAILMMINEAYFISQSSALDQKQKKLLCLLLEQILIENVVGKYLQELIKLLDGFQNEISYNLIGMDIEKVVQVPQPFILDGINGNKISELLVRLQEHAKKIPLSNQNAGSSQPMLNVIEEYIAGKEKNLVIIGQKAHVKELPAIFKKLVATKNRFPKEQLENAKQEIFKKIAKTTEISHNWRIVGVVFLAICLPPLSLISLCWTLPWLKQKRQEGIIKRTVVMSEWKKISVLRQRLKSSEKKADSIVNKQGELRKCLIPDYAHQTMTLFMTVHQAERFDLLKAHLKKPASTHVKLKEDLEASKAQSRARLPN